MSKQDRFPSMTEDEHRLVSLLGEVAGLFSKISGHDPGTGPEDDREVVHHIHALQRMVMANAAARSYPGRYRIHGGPSPGVTEDG